jgi:hypothetical protein
MVVGTRIATCLLLSTALKAAELPLGFTKSTSHTPSDPLDDRFHISFDLLDLVWSGVSS